jgi:peroxiredoxin (alkyl hydroperoxide reductase subunit C)
MIKLNMEAPSFKAMAMQEGHFKEVDLKDYKGKFVVLFFYPADFTFVCPTELEDMAEKYQKIKELGGEVLSISTDTHFVHLAWYESSPRISKIKFPMVADPTHEISKAYDVLRDGQGVADRATIIIDPDGLIKGIEITDEPIGRNADELVRKIEALKFARENPGIACPAKWEPGKETLKPGEDLVGKL